MTKAAETPDLMARIAKFYRLSVIGEAGAFRGVITHKATGKSPDRGRAVPDRERCRPGRPRPPCRRREEGHAAAGVTSDELRTATAELGLGRRNAGGPRPVNVAEPARWRGTAPERTGASTQGN